MYLPKIDVEGPYYCRVKFNPHSIEYIVTQDSALENTKWGSSKKEEKKFASSLPKKQAKAVPKASNVLDYVVVEKKDVSYANTPRMIYRIVLKVADVPLEEQMKETASYIWKDGNKNWKEFTVFIYLPGMDTGDFAYAIAEFRPYGLKEFKMQTFTLIGTKWESILRSKIAKMPTKSIQLSVEMRKKIYREFTDDPMWAYDDGTDKIPKMLTEKYMKKYKLTRSQLSKILIEGADKYW